MITADEPSGNEPGPNCAAQPHEEANPAVLPGGVEQDAIQAPARASRRTFDVAHRDFSKFKDGRSKLDVIWRAKEACSGVDSGVFTQGYDRSWLKHPVLKCLDKHYGGNDDEFIEAWSSRIFKHGKFHSAAVPPLADCLTKQ